MKRKQGFIDIRWYFTLIVFLEFVAAAGLSLVVMFVLQHFFTISSKTAGVFLVLFSCLVIGSGWS